MINRFSNISMNGRMAYIIMCVEAFLVTKYPQKDWHLVAAYMWEATKSNWGEWPNKYCSILPEILLPANQYDAAEFGDFLSQADYTFLKNLYSGITLGEDDFTDEISYMLNKPFELAMFYEGTVIGDGKESYKIIKNTELILKKNNISLPDISKLEFSSINEKNGWGNDFDGTFLSIIIQQ